MPCHNCGSAMHCLASDTFWCVACGAIKYSATGFDVPKWSRPLRVEGVAAPARDWLMHVAGLGDKQLLDAIGRSYPEAELNDATLRIMNAFGRSDDPLAIVPGSDEDREARRAAIAAAFRWFDEPGAEPEKT